MFEAAELGHKLSKGQYKRIEPKLRADLLDAQYDLSGKRAFPVIILISGVRGAGSCKPYVASAGTHAREGAVMPRNMRDFVARLEAARGVVELRTGRHGGASGGGHLPPPYSGAAHRSANSGSPPTSIRTSGP